MSPHLLPADWELYLVLRLSDSDGVTPVSFLGVHLVDGRLWDLSAPIIVTASCSCGKRNTYLSIYLGSILLDCPNTPTYHAWCSCLTRSLYTVMHITNFIAWHVCYFPHLHRIHSEKGETVLGFLMSLSEYLPATGLPEQF